MMKFLIFALLQDIHVCIVQVSNKTFEDTLTYLKLLLESKMQAYTTPTYDGDADTIKCLDSGALIAP